MSKILVPAVGLGDASLRERGPPRPSSDGPTVVTVVTGIMLRIS
jgi:hypothetical protein